MTKTPGEFEVYRLAHEASQRERAKLERVRRLAGYSSQLPLFPADKRAIPTDFVRSALFTARHDRDVEKVERRIIASVEGIVLDYSGRILTQGHARTWEAILACCSEAKTTAIAFRGRSFAKRLNASGAAGKSQREQLRKTLDELSRAHVEVLHLATGITIKAGMINLADNGADHFVAGVAPGMVQLFHESRVHIDPAVDVLLRGRLAQWLYRYLCATVEPIAVSEIRRLSDSQTKDVHRFRRAVRDALDELGAHGVLSDWAIDETDRLQVAATRPPRVLTTGGERPKLLP